LIIASGLAAVLMELTGNRGVELVIDPLGGSSWKKAIARCELPDGWGLWYVHRVGFRIRGKLRALKALAQTPKFPSAGANESK